MITDTQARLAIDGGAPVRDVNERPWPRWPVFDEMEEQALLRVLRSGVWWSAPGGEGKAFEEAFSRLHDARYGVTCANGTAGLQAALRALGIGRGDEVIVPAYTFVAPARAVLSVGALPVFADVDPDTLTLDPAAAEAAITPATAAIIPVHVAGRPADLDAFPALAARRKLALIEDAAQAHAASWRGKGVGSYGDLGAFSFQASKNLNSGEGGIVLTSRPDLADAVWTAVNIGRRRESADTGRE